MSLAALEQVLRARRVDAPPGSYSVTLVTDPEQASRKIMEEAYEVCVELLRPTVDRPRVAEEAADLLFHLLAGLVAVDVDLADVLAELVARRGPDTPTAAGASNDATSDSEAVGHIMTSDSEAVGHIT